MNQYQIETYNIYQSLLSSLDLSKIGFKKQWYKYHNSYCSYFRFSNLNAVDLYFNSNIDSHVSYCLNIDSMLCNNNVVIYLNKLIDKHFIFDKGFEFRKEFVNRPSIDDIFEFIKNSLSSELIICEQLSLFDI